MALGREDSPGELAFQQWGKVWTTPKVPQGFVVQTLRLLEAAAFLSTGAWLSLGASHTRRLISTFLLPDSQTAREVSSIVVDETLGPLNNRLCVFPTAAK